jgi:hypothetical protein
MLATLQAATRNPARVLGLADSLGGSSPASSPISYSSTPTPSRTSATRRRSAPSSPTAGSIAAPTSTSFWLTSNVESVLKNQIRALLHALSQILEKCTVCIFISTERRAQTLSPDFTISPVWASSPLPTGPRGREPRNGLRQPSAAVYTPPRSRSSAQCANLRRSARDVNASWSPI